MEPDRWHDPGKVESVNVLRWEVSIAAKIDSLKDLRQPKALFSHLVKNEAITGRGKA